MRKLSNVFREEFPSAEIEMFPGHFIFGGETFEVEGKEIRVFSFPSFYLKLNLTDNNISVYVIEGVDEEVVKKSWMLKRVVSIAREELEKRAVANCF